MVPIVIIGSERFGGGGCGCSIGVVVVGIRGRKGRRIRTGTQSSLLLVLSSSRLFLFGMRYGIRWWDTDDLLLVGKW